jgi:transcriptional regulator of acetoin/glycerol metabolism
MNRAVDAWITGELSPTGAFLMISIFQTPKSNKPVAKAVYGFDEESGAKWIPLNKSFIALAKIILQTAAERMGVKGVAVTLSCITHQGYRHLILKGDESNQTANAFGAVEEFIISNEDSLTPMSERFGHVDTVSTSMDYRGQRLGYLLATLPSADFAEQAMRRPARVIESELQVVASELGSIITRYQTRYRAIFIYGDQNYWIGNSAALRQLDKRIEQLKDVTKPVFIRGNKGTGKTIAARSLHCSRHQSILPFIESSCNEWQEGAAASILQALYAYAKGGTLYLRNVDALSGNNLQVLQSFWESIKKDLAVKGIEESAGIIFSVSRKHYSNAHDLNEWLKENTVELALPDLADRREDLRDLVNFFIREYTLSVEFDFTEHAWRLLEAFNWRENVDQLKRVVQKVALVAEEPLISVSLLEPLLRD